MDPPTAPPWRASNLDIADTRGASAYFKKLEERVSRRSLFAERAVLPRESGDVHEARPAKQRIAFSNMRAKAKKKTENNGRNMRHTGSTIPVSEEALELLFIYRLIAQRQCASLWIEPHMACIAASTGIEHIVR